MGTEISHPIAFGRLEALVDQWNMLELGEKEGFLDSLPGAERKALERITSNAEGADKWFSETMNFMHPVLPPRDAANHKPGDMIAHFRIESLIRQRIMCSVYVAKDTHLNRMTALKLVDLHSVQNYKEFLREARIIARFEHDNICSIRSSGFTDDHTGYMEMPLYKGDTLRSNLDGKRPSIEETLSVARQVAAGLEIAHSAGIIHRDIKPENLFVEQSGRVRILDFGIARMMSRFPSTIAGVLKGTIPYVSPESITDPPAGPETDFWSLGVVLYEMASGKQPFRGTSIVEIIDSILKTEPDPVPGISAPLDLLLKRCLEKNPEKRIQSAEEVREILGPP